MERALAVAPMNPTYRKIAGLYYLQSDRPKIAAEQFRHQLELQPRQFNLTMSIVTGRSNRSVDPIPPEVISEILLPDDPKMLNSYATEYQKLDPEQQRVTFERAANLLENLDFRSNSENQLLGNIRSLQGETEKAIKAYDDYLLIVPDDLNYLYKRALLLEELGKFELALEDANRLVDRATDPKRFRDFARKLRLKLAERKEKKR